MATRRQLMAEGFTNTSQTLLDYLLKVKAAEKQSALVGARQRELAGYNDKLRSGQAEDQRDFATRERVLGDPTGGVAQTLVDAGETKYQPFVPSGETATNRFGSGLNKITKREELPADVGLETGLAAAPGGRDAAKDPRRVMELIQQRDAKANMLGKAEDVGVDVAGRTAKGQAYGQQTGHDQGVAEFAPTARSIKVADERALNPVLTSRAGSIATAQESARTVGEGARAKQAAEMAANDPVIAGIAEAVIGDPTLLKQVPAAQRGYVMAALKSDKFKTQGAKRTKEILDTAYTALARMEANQGGLEGATGPRIGDPSRWLWGGAEDPIGGTDSANFQTDFSQFKAALSLDKIELIRGMGHMSDNDLKVLTAAATSLNNGMKTPRFQQGIEEARKSLLNSYTMIGAQPPDLSQLPSTQKAPEMEKLELFRQSQMRPF